MSADWRLLADTFPIPQMLLSGRIINLQGWLDEAAAADGDGQLATASTQQVRRSSICMMT